VIVVLGGAALTAALLFLYVAAVMFAGGRGFMRPVSREERYRFHLLRGPQKLKRYRLDGLFERLFHLPMLRFFGPIVVAFIMLHLAVTVLAANYIGFYVRRSHRLIR
jgi:hypothetical protein